MTVSSTNTKNSYSGNGSTTVFAYTFKIFDDDDISVILRTDATGGETVQTKGTHYSVSGVGSAGGGNITFVTPPASGITVVLIRATVQTQTTDYTPNDPFPAASHEEALDRLTLMVQDQQEELDRSIKVSRTNTISSSEFTIGADDRANKVFAFDENGDFSVTQEIGTYKGTDSTVTTSAYSARDIVKSTTTAQLDNVYIATQNSPAGILLTNTTYWQLLIDAVAAATSATNAAASATAAAASETAAAASESAAATSEANAATSESNASTSATNAATSATASAASASAASTSETNAATSATNASTSATAAASSATAAASSATAAAASETAAATSETNAGTSETNAATSATNAATSETNAGTSETNAATSATNAAASETNAATSETNAASSASSSSSSATASAASASAASTSETNAATSATNASNSASAASTSETNAASSASSASTSASTATTQAGIATTKAGEAATSATNAATSATNAATAQTAAESARDATLAAYDNFDDRYLGTKSSAPTLDNDGNALVAGALYFDSTAGAMYVYTGSAWVAAYVSGTGFLALTGGTMTGDINFGDNDKAIFGAGSDLQIYHDASHSYIQDAGTGSLFVQASNLILRSNDTTENYMRGIQNGSVELYHNGIKKIETTATGVDITGGFTATNSSTITTADNTTQLTLLSTDDDASEGPRLDLRRDSASPAIDDLIGTIRFLGENSNGDNNTFAEIQSRLKDVTAGTIDSELQLLVRRNNSLREALSLDTDTVVFNESGDDVDFRIESDTNPNMFKLDGATNKVGIGKSPTQGTLDVDGDVYATAFSGDGSGLTNVGGGNPPTIQAFTTSGTWTKPTGCKTIKVTVVGGGGGGGGADGTDGSNNLAAGGGGGGGGAIEYIDVTAVSSVAVTCGAGGSAGTTGAGGSGGTSSFGAYCSATGGTGGAGIQSSGNGFVQGGAGGIGSGGDLNVRGNDGQIADTINGGLPASGGGGSSILSGGGNGRHQSGGGALNGGNGVAGSGGGGGFCRDNSGVGNGGVGGSGTVLVEEYY